MKTEVKQKWIEALRSGQYRQGIHQLRCLENTFCCMGVLCDIHSKEVGQSWVRGPAVFSYGKISDDVLNISVLPAEVREWAGLGSCNPTLNCIPCSKLNDELGKTFSEIADLIEQEFPEGAE